MEKQTNIKQIVCQRFRKENKNKKINYYANEAVNNVIDEITISLFCKQLREEPNDVYNKLLNKFNERYHGYFSTLEACLLKDKDMMLYQKIWFAFGKSLTKEKKTEIYFYCISFYKTMLNMKHLQ